MNNYKVRYFHVPFVTESTKEFLSEQNSCFSSFKFQGQPTKTFMQNINNVDSPVLPDCFAAFQRH